MSSIEFTPIFDIARIEPTGQAVIADRAAPSASVELLCNGYVHDRAAADSSGQFVMVPPRLPSGNYELTLRSRLPDGTEVTSKKSVVVMLQPKAAPGAITLDKLEDGIAAYLHGDYAAAQRLFQPLAERGDASAQLLPGRPETTIPFDLARGSSRGGAGSE
jgi:hypothetical protein